MKTTKHRLLGLAVLASTALPSIAAAQTGTGGFQFGDLYLNTPAWSGPSSADGAIVRIDPVTGQSTLLHDLAASGPMTQGITYDPFRDRLLFFGGFVPNTLELWASDAAGNLQSLGMQTVSGGSRGLLTPRGDGIVYLLDPTNPSVLSYLDAQNQVHTLMDASGTAPYQYALTMSNIQALVYVPKSNALMIGRWSFFGGCPGAPNDVTTFHRLELSPDGTRVLSDTCTWFDAVPNDWDGEASGFSIGPDGDPILVVGRGNTGNGPQSRIVTYDMETDTASAFATTDFFAQQRIVAGSYSRTTGRVVVLDSFNDVLRAFAPGQVGEGTILAGGVSSPGGSNEKATLIEITPPTTATGLTGTPSTLSASAGGIQSWSLDLDSSLAGQGYLILGSAAGWAPGLTLGALNLPLNPDAWFDLTLSLANQPPLVNSFGLLDGNGDASASLDLSSGVSPALVGLVFHHAALVFDSGLQVIATTNPVPLELIP